MLNEINPIVQNWRKLLAFRSVSQRNAVILPSDSGMAIQINSIHELGLNRSLDDKTIALWKMEGQGVGLGRLGRACPHNVRQEAKPIVHVGIGGGLVAAVGFEPCSLNNEIARFAPEFQPWCYEGIGHMIGLQNAPLMRRMVGMPRVICPDEKAFLESFAPAERNRIALGLGRLIYFSSWSLVSAIRKIEARGYLDVGWAVYGAAFAYTMVNHRDFDSVKRTRPVYYSYDVQCAFADGVEGAFLFWKSTFPEKE